MAEIVAIILGAILVVCVPFIMTIAFIVVFAAIGTITGRQMFGDER